APRLEIVRMQVSNPKPYGDITMRFMMIVKHAETQGQPPKQLMDAITKLAEEEVKAGTMLGSGGLGPTAMGARVRLSGGKVTVIDGPFTETNEVVGGFAQFELKSKEEAVASAVRFMELHKKYWPGWEGETEVRPMFGPEDIADCRAAGESSVQGNGSTARSAQPSR